MLGFPVSTLFACLATCSFTGPPAPPVSNCNATDIVTHHSGPPASCAYRNTATNHMTVGYGFDIETQLGHDAIAHLGLNYNEVPYFCAFADSDSGATLPRCFLRAVCTHAPRCFLSSPCPLPPAFDASNCRFSLDTRASILPPSTSCCRCSFRLRLSRQPQLVSEHTLPAAGC